MTSKWLFFGIALLVIGSINTAPNNAEDTLSIEPSKHMLQKRQTSGCTFSQCNTSCQQMGFFAGYCTLLGCNCIPKPKPK